MSKLQLRLNSSIHKGIKCKPSLRFIKSVRHQDSGSHTSGLLCRRVEVLRELFEQDCQSLLNILPKLHTIGEYSHTLAKDLQAFSNILNEFVDGEERVRRAFRSIRRWNSQEHGSLSNAIRLLFQNQRSRELPDTYEIRRLCTVCDFIFRRTVL